MAVMVDNGREGVDHGYFQPNLIGKRWMVIVVSGERENGGSRWFLIRSIKEKNERLCRFLIIYDSRRPGGEGVGGGAIGVKREGGACEKEEWSFSSGENELELLKANDGWRWNAVNHVGNLKNISN